MLDHELPEKPEFLAIQEATGAEPALIAGRLFFLWRYFDRQSIDGRIPLVGIKGISLACGGDESFWHVVARAGWLVLAEDGVSIPGFADRFGESARKRMMDAQRKAKERTGKSIPGRWHQRKATGQPPDTPRTNNGHEPDKPGTCPPLSESVSKSESEVSAGAETVTFVDFWEVYPSRDGKKRGKQASKLAFDRLGEDERALVVDAAKNYASSRSVRSGFAKDPERFFKHGFWRDWLTPEDPQEVQQQEAQRPIVDIKALMGIDPE